MRMKKCLLASALGIGAAVSIFLSVLPKQNNMVKADSAVKSVEFGTNIAGVYYNQPKAGVIYYGMDGDTPLKWRPIGSNNFGVATADGTITLLAEKTIGSTKFCTNNGNDYDDSLLKIRMDEIRDDCLTQVEESAIRTRTLAVEEHIVGVPYSDGVSGTTVYNQYLWPLSTYEAFKVNFELLKCDQTYWLRTPGHFDYDVAMVYPGGNFNPTGTIGSANNFGIRPACMLNYNNIVMISAATKGKPQTAKGEFAKIPDYDGNEWKLTLQDARRFGFSAERTTSGSVSAGQLVSIKFSGAKLLTNSGDERVSVVLLDPTNVPVYYGRLSDREDHGTNSIRIPVDLQSGKYTMRVFSELNSGNKKTDYISNIVNIPIVVDNSSVEAPEAPRGLVAQASQTSTSSIRLAWDPNFQCAGYTVYRATSANGTYTNIGSVDSSVTNKTAVNLESGKQYFFKIRAYNLADGQKIYSPYSNVVSAVTILDAVTGLKTKADTTGSVVVSWNAVAGARGYSVYRSTSMNGTYSLAGNVITTSRRCPGLTSGKQYFFKVVPYVEYSGTKYYGKGTVVAGVPQLKAPLNVSASPASTTAGKVSWNAVSGATGYVVYRSTSKNGPYTRLETLSATSRICRGLTSGTRYYFKVRAYVEYNGKKYYGRMSDPVSVVPPCAAPSNVKVVRNSSTSVKVSWDRSEGATAYIVYRATSQNGSYTRLGTVSSLNRVCSGLTTGSTYYFKVRAVTTIGGTEYYGITSEPVRITVR